MKGMRLHARLKLGAAAAATAALCVRVHRETRCREKKQEELSDVVVIGGGILGSSVAYHASRLGGKVTMIERASVASEASGLSAGTVWNGGWSEKMGAPTTAKDVSQFLRAGSCDILKQLRGCDFTQCGALEVACSDDESKFLKTQFDGPV